MTDTDIASEYFSWGLVQQIAQENGYFEDEGVELADAAPGTREFAAGGTNGRETDRGKDGNGRETQPAVCERRPVREAFRTNRRIVGSSYEQEWVLFVSTDSDIDSVEEVRGRAIAVGDRATPRYPTAELLEEAGLDETAVVTERIGAVEKRFEAVKSGAVDAIAVRDPYATLGRYDAALEAVYEDARRVALVVSPAVESEWADAFRTALNRAVEEIEDDRSRYRERYVDLLEDSVPDGQFEDVDVDRLRDELELQDHLPVRAADADRIGGPTEWMAEGGYVEDGEGGTTIPERRTPY